MPGILVEEEEGKGEWGGSRITFKMMMPKMFTITKEQSRSHLKPLHWVDEQKQRVREKEKKRERESERESERERSKPQQMHRRFTYFLTVGWPGQNNS